MVSAGLPARARGGSAGCVLLVQAAANLIIAIIVLIIGAILYRLSLNAGQYALTVLVSILGSAVFLALGQALVGLFRSLSTVNAIGRILYVVLILLGLLGATGILGDTIKALSQWTPVGAIMVLYSTALDPSAASINGIVALLVCLGYIIVFAFWESAGFTGTPTNDPQPHLVSTRTARMTG